MAIPVRNINQFDMDGVPSQLIQIFDVLLYLILVCLQKRGERVLRVSDSVDPNEGLFNGLRKV